MKAVLLLLQRALLPKQGSLLTFALWISVAGLALGIVQLIVVLAVMSGFQEMFRKNFTRISSELVVVPRSGQKYHPKFRTKLEAVEGIEAVTPFADSQALILKDGISGGVFLEGLDLTSFDSVTPWESIWVDPPDQTLSEKGHWIWLGTQLAKKIGAQKGDTVSVMLVRRKKKRIVSFVVTAIAKFGIYNQDLHYAAIDFNLARKLTGRTKREPMYKTKLAAGIPMQVLTDRIFDSLGPFVTLKPWTEINENMFQAVEHQKWLLFLALQIIIALAAVNVVTLLIMSATARRRDMAILRAMGMRGPAVFSYFTIQGTAVGVVGIGVGVGLGYLFCLFAEKYQPHLISESIYNVTKLPFRVQWNDVGAICLAGLIVCLVFSLLPALRASMQSPVEELRNDL